MNFFKLSLFLLLFFHMPLHAKNKPLESVTLQLQWKHQFEFAGFYAAKEKGFYADAGLDVSFIEYDKTKNITDEVLNGKAEYGLTYSSIIADYLNGKSLVLLANFFKQSPLVLVAQTDIRTPADLKGKKVMGLSDSIHNITLLTMLNKFNIYTEDIVNIPASFNINDFVTKKVDAMSIFTTNELYTLDKKGIKYTLFDPVAYGAKYYDANLFTSRKELSEHPQRVKRFREASIKGWEYALKHQNEIIEIILKKYNTQHKSREALQFEAKQIEYIMLPKVHKVGSIDINRIKMIAESFMQSGFSKVEDLNDLEDFLLSPTVSRYSDTMLTAQEKEFIKLHPKIVLGTSDSWEPYVIQKSDGSIVGYDHDILTRINKATGANFVLLPGNWLEMQKMAKSGTIDGLSTLTVTPERKEFLNFSDIYISLKKIVMVKKRNPLYIRSNKDMTGKTIVIHKGNLADEAAARQFKDSKIIYADTPRKMLEKVIYGKADATFGNGATEYLLNKLGLPYMENAYALNKSLDLTFAVKKEWPEAVSILNKGLASIPEYEKIQLKQKWFSSKQNPSPKITLTPKEDRYLQNKKKIKMCIDPNWMPFEKIENGKHIGINADYLKLISSQINTPLILIPTTSWSESLTFFKNKKCDILSLAMETQERKKWMDFTHPYFTVPLVIVTNNSKPFISDMSELLGKQIGIIRDYAAAGFLKHQYPAIRFIEVDTLEEGLLQVVKGKLFGLVDSLTTVGYQIQKRFPRKLKISGQLNEKLALGIAVQKNESILLGILEKAVTSLGEKKKQAILNQWISIKYDHGFDYVLFWKILTPFLLLALILLISHYILRKYNKELQHEVTLKVEELRHKDEILLQKHRMAAMGEMLSMIAHQWRQPLGAISSAIMGIEVKLASGKFDLNDKNEREAFLSFLERKHHNINEYVQYLSNTTDDFRNFFNSDKSKDIISLTSPIENALNIIQTSMQNNGITIVKEYYEDDTKLALYQNEVMQVILTLLKNSEDSFLANNISDPKVTIATRKDNNTLIISVCDNGGGIPKNILDKIFDPYFSTKDEKNGTGLGLYMSKTIIEDHHNGILKMNNTENGICFEIIFKMEV